MNRVAARAEGYSDADCAAVGGRSPAADIDVVVAGGGVAEAGLIPDGDVVASADVVAQSLGADGDVVVSVGIEE